MTFDLRPCSLTEVRALCAAHHGYQSAGGTATYCFGVYESAVLSKSACAHCGEQPSPYVSVGDQVLCARCHTALRARLVAAYAWQPPSPGAAKSVCPEAPYAVLALSRMVAVPKAERQLKHVSKPLMAQMKRFIDRSRWPVLVTYSDEGEGHTGYVYQCSGWTPTLRSEVKTYEDADGRRVSPYSNGAYARRAGVRCVGTTFIQRWEHWVCEYGYAGAWLETHGWVREPVPGKVWRSGNPAFRYVRREAAA